MLIYINPEGKYPSYYGEIQERHPGWVPGDALPEGWHEVVDTAMPDVPEGKTAEELAPVLFEGRYTRQWAIRDFTEEEIRSINAPVTALEKLMTLDLTPEEKLAINYGRVRL